MRTGIKPACDNRPVPCCSREDLLKQRGPRASSWHNIPILCPPSTYWRKQQRNKISKRRFRGANKSRACVQKIRTVSLISFPLRYALESSILREKRWIKLPPMIVTGLRFMSLQAGWLVRKEILPNKKNNSPLP